MSDTSALARRGSETGSIVQRLGSCTAVPWESWEHPANIPLHAPRPPTHSGGGHYEQLGDAEEQAQSQQQLMLRECQQ